jgi:CRISPR-associated protein Csb1
MEGGLKRLEGISIPRVTLSGVKKESMSLLDVGHRVADAAVWSADNYNEFQQALEAYVRGDSAGLAKLAPTSLVFGYWDSRGKGGKARRLVRSEIFAENVVKLTRRSQYWASVDPEVSEDLQKALGEAKAKARGDDEKDAGSQLGFRDAPASGLGGVIAHGDIVRLTILSLTGLRNLSAREDGNEDADGTKKLRRYLLGLMLAAASSLKGAWDLREGCMLVQERRRNDDEKDDGPDITWTDVYHDGREQSREPLAASTVVDYVRKAAVEFFGPEFPGERALGFNAATAAQRVRGKLAEKEQTPATGSPGNTGGAAQTRGRSGRTKGR